MEQQRQIMQRLWWWQQRLWWQLEIEDGTHHVALAKDFVTLAALASSAKLLPPSAAEAVAMPDASASEGIHIILVLEDKGEGPLALVRWPTIGIDTPPRRWLSPVHGCTAAKAGAWTIFRFSFSSQVKSRT